MTDETKYEDMTIEQLIEKVRSDDFGGYVVARKLILDRFNDLAKQVSDSGWAADYARSRAEIEAGRWI